MDTQRKDVPLYKKDTFKPIAPQDHLSKGGYISPYYISYVNLNLTIFTL